jgi:hypothetical protein
LAFFILKPCTLIRYKPQAQLTIEGFENPFDRQLDPHNRWVILAGHIPWDKLASVYYKKMRSDFGPPTLDARMVIGAVIIKHMLNIDDREVVEQIKENIYLQYFVGLSGFQTTAPFDPSLMVSIRKRLGVEVMDQFNTLVLQQAGIVPSADRQDETKDQEGGGTGSVNDIKQAGEAGTENASSSEKPTTPKRGTLMIDATVAEQQIDYPTDLKLLNEGRKHLERMTAKVCRAGGIKQPRMYKNVARRNYLLLAKKKHKTKSQIRKGLRSQLQYVKRDLGYIDKLLTEGRLSGKVLTKRDWKLLQVIHEMYRQQRQMFDQRVHSIENRIVSIYQPHVRPIPRGKDKAATEFGSKQLVMQKEGYTHVQKIDWENYNEGILLPKSVEAYKEFYGCYPEAVSADRIFGTRENRRYLKEHGIRFIGKALGRPPAATSRKQKRTLEKEMAKRSAIEGKFGQGKNGYGLAKIRARLKDTAESWIMSIYFVMNLVKLARAGIKDYFLFFFHWVLYVMKLIRSGRKLKIVSMTPLSFPIGIRTAATGRF